MLQAVFQPSIATSWAGKGPTCPPLVSSVNDSNHGTGLLGLLEGQMSKALGMPRTGMTPAVPKQASQLLLCAEQPATDKAKKEAGSPTKEDSMEPLEQSQVSQARETRGSLRRLGGSDSWPVEH